MEKCQKKNLNTGIPFINLSLVDTDYEHMEMNPQLLQNRVKAVIKDIKLAIFQQDSDIEEIYQVICQKNKEMQLN